MPVLIPIDIPPSCMDCPCSHYNPMLFSVTCAVSQTVMSDDEAKQGRVECCQMRDVKKINAPMTDEELEDAGFEL